MYVRHLPPDGALGRRLHSPEDYEALTWTRTDHLIAGLYDSVQLLIWQNERIHSKSRRRRPDPLPRPGVRDKTKRYGKPRPLSEVKAILASSRPGADQPQPAEVTDGG